MRLEEKIKEQWFHENNTSPAGAEHRDGLVLVLQPVEKGKLNFEAEEWIQ